MIQRNGHFIQVTPKNMTSTALCLKCRGEVSAINYDGKSDPSMNLIFNFRCQGDWKKSRSRLVAAVAEAEEALKTLRTWIAYDRTPKKMRGSFSQGENTQRINE
jgi:hypothetical protein